MSAEVFEAAAACDYEKLAELLIAMPEKERRALHDQLMANTLERASQHFQKPNLPARYTHQVVRVGTGTAKDFSPWWAMVFDLDGLSAPNLADVLLCRPANVYKGMARTIFRSGRGLYFVTLYGLMQRGLIDRPPEAQLQTAMAQSIRKNHLLFSQPEAVDLLCGALQDESVIRATNGSLLAGVFDAVNDGVLPRARILSEVFHALCRDFTPGVATDFRWLLARLAPSDHELGERCDLLVSMLAGGLPPNQTLAAELLVRVHAVEPIADLDRVARALQSAMATPQKSTVTAAFRLFQSLNLDSNRRADIAIVGLTHPNADVQLASLKVLEACGPLTNDVLSQALLAESTMAPKHQERFSALVGIDIVANSSINSEPDNSAAQDRQAQLITRVLQLPEEVRARLGLDLVARTPGLSERWPRPQVFRASDVPRGRPVLPITDPEELVDLLLTASVGSVSALDIDRIVDGVTRIQTPIGVSQKFAHLVTPDHQGHSWTPLVLRLAILRTAFSWSRLKTHGPYPYLEPADERGSILRHELKAEPSSRNHFQAFDLGAGASGVLGFVTAKLWEAVAIGFAESRGNLAFPSTDDGWISSSDFCSRLELLKSRDETPGRFEAIHALNRLHPASDDQTLLRLEAIGTPIAATALRGLSSSVLQTGDRGLDRSAQVHPMPGEFLATVENRDYNSSYRLRFVRPLAIEPQARRRDDPVGEMEWECYEVSKMSKSFWWSPHFSAAPTLDPDLMRWTQIAFPKDLPIFEARIATCIGESIEENRSSDSLHLTVSALADPDHPWTAPSYVLLGVALAAKSQTLAAAGVDAFFAGATDGRLDTQRLGRVLAQLSTSSFLKPSRLADRLTKIVQTSPLVAEQIRRALEVFLAGISALPQGSAALLELLDIACSQTCQAIEDPAARAVLEAASIGSSKTATSAKRLLQLAAVSNTPLVLDATEALIVRAERWGAAGSQ
jgi:Family of unknown function (DUF6493)